MIGYNHFYPNILGLSLWLQIIFSSQAVWFHRLGKGIAAASLAAILEARGLNVTIMKLDPYINVDPGTMSPTQHGEVFVTRRRGRKPI